jgi:hypothetical protein
MPKFGTIDIQLVKKTKKDIENVIKYMNKTKKRHKSKSKQMNQNSKFQISIFDYKISSTVVIDSKSVSNQNNSELKMISKLSLFDFQSYSKTKTTIKSK